MNPPGDGSRPPGMPPASPFRLGLLVLTRLFLFRRLVESLRQESRFKTATLAVFAAAFWAGSFFSFRSGFNFLLRYPEFFDLVTYNVFALFLFALFLMLFVSNTLLLFSALFRAPETAWLLSQPVPAEDVFIHQWSLSVAFSSWAFLFLAFPLSLAYGIATGHPLGAPLAALLVFPPFLVIISLLAALFLLLFLRLLPRTRGATLVLFLVLALLPVLRYLLPLLRKPQTPELSAPWLIQTFNQLRFCHEPWWPSAWVNEVLVGFTPGGEERACYFLLLLAWAAFLYLAARAASRRWFRLVWSKTCSFSTRGKRVSWMGRLGFLARAWPGGERSGLPLLKDFICFFRDPSQTLHLVLFLGLLAFYFLNLRHFSYQERDLTWRNLIATFNLAASALTLATFANRFVFPQISLEGKRFWVLGVLPLSRRHLVMTKFLFSSLILTLLGQALILLSSSMLELPWKLRLFHQGISLVFGLTLSGLNVGLSARYPNFREDNPGKIISGFGGTLTLVASLVYLVGSLILLIWPLQWHYANRLPWPRGFWWLGSSLALFLLASLAAGYYPLRIGIRHLERQDF